jgi:hypothetical protein
VIAFYISGHGFGHASRDIEVLNALLDRRPDIPILVRTPAQRWLFDLTLRHPVRFEPAETDTGIAQIDSLRLDAAESIRRAAAFYRDFEAKAAAEAAHLRQLGVRLVVADIPPLAFRAAALAGVPAVALGNFTWDWIYAGYAAWLGDAPDLVPTIARAYATAALALRLPMHGGFRSTPNVRDIPLVARRSHRDPAEVRAALALPRDRRLVLLSFGGHGLQDLDVTRLDTGGAYTVLTTGDYAAGDAGNVVRIDERGLYEAGLRYEDLVACADVVLTKPGYGIISECVANDTAMLYTSRGHFVEYEVLVECLPAIVRSRFISQEDLYAGAWRAHLDLLLAQPPPATRPATDGADVAAGAILEMLDRFPA